MNWRWPIGVFLHAFRLQLVAERLPSFLLSFALGPIVSIIYVLMARGAGRNDLEAFVVLTPIAVGLWGTASLTAGDAILLERWSGTLELLVASPAPPAIALLGRITASVLFALIAIPETLVIVNLLGVKLVVVDPIAFIAAILALAFSAVGIGLIAASTYVLASGARLFSSLLGFPFFIVAGVAFPISVLPVWVQPLSFLVSMTWAADILRKSAGVLPSTLLVAEVGATLGLGLAYLALGFWLLRIVERRVRHDGSIGGSL